MNLKFYEIKLRIFRKSDTKKLVELANNEKVGENLRDAFPSPYTMTDAELFIKNCLKQDPIFNICY